MKGAGKILLVVGILFVLAAAALVAWRWDAIVARLAQDAVTRERQAWLQRTQELESIISNLRSEREASLSLPTERLRQVFGPESPLVHGTSPQNLSCAQLEEALQAFCRYLDGSETLSAKPGPRDSWALLQEVRRLLERNLPVASGEVYRPDLIIKNTFHFFRVLRKHRIDLLRDILAYEADLAEPLSGILYHWLMQGGDCQNPGISTRNLQTLYQYAAFFLNTLGGHSYLQRRDSRVRLLTAYYAVLIVHEANLKRLNEAGIDLRFFLPLLFNEIQNRKDLMYTEEYLQKLSNLQLHYFRSSPSQDTAAAATAGSG